MGTPGFGKTTGALRGTGKGNWRSQRAAASLGQHRPAAADSNSYTDTDAESQPDDFTLRLTQSYSIFQRNAVTNIAAVDSPDIRVSNGYADRDERLDREKIFRTGGTCAVMS
jgi:hypothetical protein